MSSSSSSSLTNTPVPQSVPTASQVMQVLGDFEDGPPTADVSPKIRPNSTTKDRGALWKYHLIDSRDTCSIPKFPDDINSIPLDEPNQRVIKVDCDRTRGNVDGFLQVRTEMEAILTFYCNQLVYNGLLYDQPLNKIQV